jgi:site-specific recombinase XerD
MANRFSYHVTKYFAEYLPLHIGASKNTCKSYRDAFVQLLGFIGDTRHIAPDKIELGTITAVDVEHFLLHLEKNKRVGISTRNQRLAAIHSFFRYLQKKELPCFGQCSDILAVPFKRNPPGSMSYLSIDEIKVLFSVPNTKSRRGLRDLAVLTVLYETGARVQELIDLTPAHMTIDVEVPYVELRGKGNKVRRVPIAAEVAAILRRYMDAFHICHGHGALFTNQQGKKLTRVGVQYIVDKNMDLAEQKAPGLCGRKITNHSFRHSKAMHLLEAGVNLIYIRDFLGHSSVTTTEIYARTNPDIKRKILTENNLVTAAGSHYDTEEKEDLLEWLKNNL